MRFQILYVSGQQDDARHLRQMLHELPMAIDHAESVEQARTKLRRRLVKAVLTEATLPDGNWLDVLKAAGESPGKPKVVVTDRQADARLWAEVLNLGGYDLLVRPFYEPEVRRILNNVCSRPERVKAAG